MKIRYFICNLQCKVLILLFMVAMVPLMTVAFLSIHTAEELITRMAYNQLSNVADDKVSLLDRWLAERKADLQVVASSSILVSMAPDLIAPYLRLVEEQYGVYKGFIVLDADKNVVYSSFREGLPSGWPDYKGEPASDALTVSDILPDPDQNDSFFHITTPISGENREVKGQIYAAVGTRMILSIILRVSLGKTGESYLVDRNGTFLAHKEPHRILTQNIAQSESFKNIFGEANPRRVYTDYRGIDVLGVSRKVPDTDWFLVVEQDRDEAFMSADKLRRYVYVVIVCFMAATAIISWLLSYYIVHPVRRLSEAAGTLARGEFEKAQVSTTRADEIGMLYHAFEDMARRLQVRQSSLENRVNLTEAELKETDVRLQKAQRAAVRSEQMAALGRLAAGVTHEIRTPLASLKLFLQSIQGEIAISPEFEEDFQIAMNQILRIEATINRFLDFAKPQEPVFSSIDVRQLIEDALLVVKPRANQQETTVRVTVDDKLPAILGDKKQLGEALLNLMVNALDAMAYRGTLTVTSAIEQGGNGLGQGSCIRIDVADTGSGIPEDDIPRLFEPFFTTKASGTGLGLPIVYSTLRKHGGDISVESTPGKGTAFSILLPVQGQRKEKAFHPAEGGMKE